MKEGDKMSQKLYAKVFGWLFVGLFITFGTGLFLTHYQEGVINLFGGSGYFIAILV